VPGEDAGQEEEAMIELRSDTFTVPSPLMRERIAAALVGDDGYGEDPTVNRLEGRAAELAGQESACLMPSGTMANLCGVLARAQRGEAVLAGHLSDIYVFEAGGLSVLGSAVLRPVRNLPDGTLDPGGLQAELTVDTADPQFARPAVVCLETTHDLCGGVPLEPGYVAGTAALARRHGAALHLDGARIFNAAVALGIAVAEIGALADTVQFCLSKGLGAPVGSVLAGPAATIARARRLRKMLGGAMRQAGIIAAAGLAALESPAAALRADHHHAAGFAESIAVIPGITVLNQARTNLVFFRAGAQGHPQEAFLAACAGRGLRMSELTAGVIRAAFHRDVLPEQAEEAVKIIREVAAELQARSDSADTPDGILSSGNRIPMPPAGISDDGS
jgi:threonine aldolase